MSTRHLFGFAVQSRRSFSRSIPPSSSCWRAVFSWLWVALARRGFEPSTPAKFGLGVLQVGLGFAALVYGAQQADGERHRRGGLARARVSAAHHRRVVFVAGRAVDGHEVVGAARRRFDDGRVVSVQRVLALRRRPDRGRGERIGDAGRGGRRWRRIARRLRRDVQLSSRGSRSRSVSSCSRCRRWCAASCTKRRRDRRCVATSLG